MYFVMMEFVQTCERIFMQAMASTVHQLTKFEANTKLNILNAGKTQTETNGTKLRLSEKHIDLESSIVSLPKEEYTPRYGAWIDSDESSIQQLFATSARCAIFTSPFKSIKVRLKNGHAQPLSTSNFDSSKIADDELFSAVVDALRHPPCVVASAQAYIDVVLQGRPFAAVHWRYDMRDWHHNHCIANNQPQYKKACKYLPLIAPIDVARAIDGKIREWKVDNASCSTLYVASPPSLDRFAKDVIALSNACASSPRETLSAFIRRNSRPCGNDAELSIDIDEHVSMAEMEIAMRSTWFFSAWASTWSGNVVASRPEGKTNPDGPRFTHAEILSLATRSMLHRTNDTT